MGIRLTREEQDVVQALQHTGMSPSLATLAVVMFTRGHVRPERELADIVGQYPNLENSAAAEQALARLKEMGWLVVTQSFGMFLTHKAPVLQEKLVQAVNNPALIDRLINSRTTLERNIRILGPMNTPEIYGSYIHLLRNAQREVCLPMLATSPKLAAVSIIQERARQGVHIRILLGSSEVAAKLRGATIAEKSRESIRGWIENAKGVQNMEIRIAHLPEDILFATSWSLDGHLLRFDIYDPSKQRSLEGVMIEIESPIGLNLNLIRLFQSHFDEAWNRAEPTHLLGKLRWQLSKYWQWWAFTGSTIIAFLVIRNPLGLGIACSVAATFFVNAVATSWPTIRSFVRRLVSD